MFKKTKDKKPRELVFLKVSEISLVSAPANDEDFILLKHQASEAEFTRIVSILKLSQDEQLLTGICYTANKVDLQGDFCSPEVLRQAAFDFMENSQSIKIMHSGARIDAAVVESFVTHEPMRLAGKLIEKDTWLISIKINDKRVWQKVKIGELRGLSLGGKARTKVVAKCSESEAPVRCPDVIYKSGDTLFGEGPEHIAQLKGTMIFSHFIRKIAGDGVIVVFGERLGLVNSWQAQSVRFDAARWTPPRAQVWLKEHEFGSVEIIETVA